MEEELKPNKKTDLEILAAFMTKECQTQKKQEEFTESSKGASRDSDAKARCHGCNQTGHRFAQCPRKSSQGTKKTHGTQQNPPKRCPACGDQHSGTDSDGKTFYKNRLSVCEVFRDKPLEERANIIQQTNGCALCLDWTGDHQAKACQAKGRFGKTYEACKKKVGGSLCGKCHNSLLHGMGNKYCNSVKKVSNCNNSTPNLLGKGAPGAPTVKEIEAVDGVHALFQLQYIPVVSKSVKQASTFYDPGSNMNLVSKR